jgi:excisionase family DNA binding protein
MQSNDITTPRLAYSVKEAAAALSLSKGTIWNRIADGTLPARRIGSRTVIPASSLHALIEGEAA